MSNPFDKFRIISVENPSDLPIASDVYSICFNRCGECTLTAEGIAIVLREREAALLQIDTQYTMRGECAATIIYFSDDLFSRSCLPVIGGNAILNSFFIHSAKNPTVSCLYFSMLPAVLDAHIGAMQSEFSDRQDGYEEILQCHLTSLLLYLSRCCRMNASVTEAPNSQLLQQILDYIMRNFNAVTLEDLSRHFSYHPNSMAAIIKRGTGKTFSQLLLQIRMSHAAELLRNPMNSIRSIADACGYSNMSNFYARFKAYYGMTPAEYADTMPQYIVQK